MRGGVPGMRNGNDEGEGGWEQIRLRTSPAAQATATSQRALGPRQGGQSSRRETSVRDLKSFSRRPGRRLTVCSVVGAQCRPHSVSVEPGGGRTSAYRKHVRDARGAVSLAF
ncbi:hypothetical protein EVAR_103825_1 [Eumeta japonica]|uniref:Uncharacterized protein n=1 Tax=Eumeta variegata TaxID=151549 RepID=A0A4C1SBB7_EUMVA|nr:hypothetical protein EVAR_103825_1 [Eumeta japonica]